MTGILGVAVAVGVGRHAHALKIWEVVSEAVHAVLQAGNEEDVGVAVYVEQNPDADLIIARCASC